MLEIEKLFRFLLRVNSLTCLVRWHYNPVWTWALTNKPSRSLASRFQLHTPSCLRSLIACLRHLGRGLSLLRRLSRVESNTSRAGSLLSIRSICASVILVAVFEIFYLGPCRYTSHRVRHYISASSHRLWRWDQRHLEESFFYSKQPRASSSSLLRSKFLRHTVGT